MTELSTEPVAVETAAPDFPPSATAPTEKPAAEKEVEHTPGGWPIVPLALSGANTTVGTVAAASLAGGPVAAIVAATGMVVMGTFAATRSRNSNPRREARRAAARAVGRATANRATPRGPRTGSASTGGPSHASRAGSSGGRSGRMPGQHRRSTGAGGKTRNPSGRMTDAVGRGLGRAGQVRALRTQQKAAAGSRADKRAQTTAARRAVADARRNTRTPDGARRPGGRGGSGGLGRRMLNGAAGRVRARRDRAIERNRARRDARTGATVDTQRAAVRKAPARKAARQALRRSAARFQRRRLLAGLLALPLGLLGLITSPIGRKLNIPWLIHPGRRLYRRIVGAAAEQRAERDAAIRERLQEQEAAADAEAAEDGTENIADRIERPATHTPATPHIEGGTPVSTASGFKFEDHATEMQAAAMLYEPDGCMEILAMVEGLPEALNMVAHVMQILAERSDSEFPLEKEVANGFNDIYDLLRKAAEGAEELPGIFRRVHEQDIARHEDPRNGTEAEKGWNV